MTTKVFRVFHSFYFCDHCQAEFDDIMPVVTHSFCPTCDAKVDPYASEALLEDVGDEEEA